ncbi:MAG: GIY-YIG nuclease family protein [Hydrotalea sp. AMD]|uniref:GIY-YIG nuclease family protein n=1 Tax=Hydrotalea sp. AMD TaxID=2501297 RepID=UPI0010270139|nr:GIY-YIG nuclease family protein [Hydrotalea sp. AMD]RWZ87180.1 MAG: GIY-YIG nuclease family protein [Hydrotalea sp. AMD]
MSESIYLIYKHTSPSGKSYIGLTNNYQRRCNEHKSSTGCMAFNNAIQKYGWDNFHHEILIENLTLDEANMLESKLIQSHNTLYPNGYNLREGGSHHSFSTETSQKMSNTRKGTTTAIIIETGKITRVSINDPRWASGEIVGATKGKKIGKRTKDQIQRRLNTLKMNNTKPSISTRQHWSNIRKGKRPAFSRSGESLGLIEIKDPRWDLEIFQKHKIP